jgi:tetratricopeptide (TPR) repeat protein
MARISRLLASLLVIVIVNSAFSQTMEGAWIQVKASRIDGSEIVGRNVYRGHYKYVIQSNQVLTIDTPQHVLIERMAIPLTYFGGSVARSESGSFEMISDSILVFTQKHLPNELDKKNQFVMIREKQFYRYLDDLKQIQYENDTTIISNSLIFPFFKTQSFNQSLAIDLRAALAPVSGMVSGYFIINRQERIVDIVIETNKNFEKIDNLKKALQRTDGKWQTPVKNFAYKTYFTIVSTNEGPAINISFRRNDFDRLMEAEDHQPFSAVEARLYHDTYNKGVSLAKRKQFEKAIEKFSYCIGIDSLDIDAVYNRALSYYQLNKVKEACADWRYLRDLGQVTAEKLFQKNCNE